MDIVEPTEAVHELKTWPEPFQAVAEGRKRHELRTTDRPFAVGDWLHLREFVPHEECGGSGRIWDNGDKMACYCAKPHGEYTGRECMARITYITHGESWGLPRTLCVLSVAPAGACDIEARLARLREWCETQLRGFNGHGTRDEALETVLAILDGTEPG